jgi:nucleoside-diphosphate-sugar epimerase
MTYLVLGATGATGRLLVKELLERGASVRIVVRDAARLDESLHGKPELSVVEASISELKDDEIRSLVAGCEAAASCLGHNLSFRGLFGPPYRLVTDATRRICEALQAEEGDGPRRFVLMNTTGVRNPEVDEQVPVSQRLVVLALRALLPPHADNDGAAEYLRTEVGQSHPDLEWVAVRPDSLVDHHEVSRYDLHPSPTRSAIFDAGQTSRINVAHFMASLLTDPDLWARWKGQTPVIYNDSQPVR